MKFVITSYYSFIYGIKIFLVVNWTLFLFHFDYQTLIHKKKKILLIFDFLLLRGHLQVIRFNSLTCYEKNTVSLNETNQPPWLEALYHSNCPHKHFDVTPITYVDNLSDMEPLIKPCLSWVNYSFLWPCL